MPSTKIQLDIRIDPYYVKEVTKKNINGVKNGVDHLIILDIMCKQIEMKMFLLITVKLLVKLTLDPT